MKVFHRSSGPQLSFEEASRILERAFEANEMENNSIPLEVLASYSSYRKERFTLQRTILVIIMMLFILLPLLFIPAAFTVNMDETPGRNFNPVYRLTVDSLMLVDRVSASIDGFNIPVYEVDSHIYSLEPSRNGEMEVTVTLINRQTLTQYVKVTGVDREVPTALSCSKEGDELHLYLSDDGSGIDFSGIEALDLEGNEIKVISVDEEAGRVTLPAVSDTINVYVTERGLGERLAIQIDTSVPEIKNVPLHCYDPFHIVFSGRNPDGYHISVVILRMDPRVEDNVVFY